MCTCNLLQKSLGSRQHIKACVWPIKVIALLHSLISRAQLPPQILLFILKITNKNNQLSFLSFLLSFIFGKYVFVYFSPSPFGNTQVKTLFPADRCELALVSGQGQVLFFCCSFFFFCPPLFPRMQRLRFGMD